MKLLFAIISNDDSKELVRSLIENKISVTRIASTGGFLRSGNSTLMEGFRCLQKDALFGQKCREELVKKAVSLALLLDFGGDEAVLTKAFSSLSGEDLEDITLSMERKAALLFPPQTQLPPASLTKPAMDADYMI